MLNRLRTSCVLSLLSSLVVLNLAWADQSQTRTTNFSYYDTDGSGASFGQLKYEEAEPTSSSLCVHTEYTYESHGNRTDTKIMPCAGGTSFSTREISIDYDGNSQFPVTTTRYVPSSPVTQQQQVNSNIDPRFGVPLTVTAADGLSSSIVLDALGRTVRQNASDQSYTVTTIYSCLSQTEQGYDATEDASLLPDAIQGNTTICGMGTFTHPTSAILVKAAGYTETVRYGPNNVAQGGIARIYHDKLGREIANVKTGIDVNASDYYLRTVKAYDHHGRAAYTSVMHRLDGSGNLLDITQLRWNVATFDSVGRPYRTYMPDSGDAGIITTATTDVTEDSVSINSLTGPVRVMGVDVSVDGQTKSYLVTSNGNQTLSLEEHNAIGQTLRKTDAINNGNGNQIAFSYNVQGQLSSTLTHDAAGNNVTSSVQYDLKGRKTSQTDPDLGTWNYEYNALGELTKQIDNNSDANSNWQIMTYDELGRLKTKQVSGSSGFTATYSYDCNKASYIGGDGYTYSGVGSLCEESTNQSGNGNYDKQYAFGHYGHLVHTQTKLGTGAGGKTYDTWQTYDDNNARADATTYPTTIKTKPVYSAKGFVVGVNRVDSGLNQALWTATGIDQYGTLQQWQLGNGLQTTQYQDIAGRLTSKTTIDLSANSTAIQNAIYTYNQSGDMAIRQDVVDNLQENFNYDELHRLTKWTRTSSYQNANGSTVYDVGYNYDGIGNLIYRSDRGCFKYGAGNSRPHAMTTFYRSDCSNTALASTVTAFSYDANGSLSTMVQNGSTTLREHSWNSFHQPDWIQWDANGTRKVQWLYDANLTRVQETKLLNGAEQSRIFKLNPGDNSFFEQVADPSKPATESRHFVSTPVGIIGTLVTQGEIGSIDLSKAQMEYWHTDHLGSLSVLTNDSKTVLERFQYDPFGERLDALGKVMTASRYTDRGFTGHEHIDELNIIHMNGRIFDPVLGRFLQADPNIPHPMILQSYNRYSYCMNSSVMCVDPSGFFSVALPRPMVIRGSAGMQSQVLATTPSYLRVSAGMSLNDNPNYNLGMVPSGVDYSQVTDNSLARYTGARDRNGHIPTMGPTVYVAGQGNLIPVAGATEYVPGKGWKLPLLQSEEDRRRNGPKFSYAPAFNMDTGKWLSQQQTSHVNDSKFLAPILPFVINGVVGGVTAGVGAWNSTNGKISNYDLGKAVALGVGAGVVGTVAFGPLGTMLNANSAAIMTGLSGFVGNLTGQYATYDPAAGSFDPDWAQAIVQGGLACTAGSFAVMAAEAAATAGATAEMASTVGALWSSGITTGLNAILPSSAGGLGFVGSSSSSGE